MRSSEHPTPFLPAPLARPRPNAPSRRKAWVVLAALGSTTVAMAGPCAPAVAQARDQAPPQDSPIQVEEHAGSGDPLGSFGLALVYDRRGRFSGGLGIGLDSPKSKNLPPLGLFGRVRLLRWGWGSLGVGITFSREHIHYQGFIDQNWSYWSWTPAYRATGTLGAEFALQAWSLRLDAGIGYILNGAECTQLNSVGNNVSGSCDSPQIPADLRNTNQDARLIPSLTVTLGYRFPAPSWPSPPSVDVTPGYRFPGTAMRLSLGSTLAPALAGSFMLGLGVARSNDTGLIIGGIASLALAVSFGPSVGYTYAGEPLKGWATGALRLLGIGLGALELIEGLRISSHTSQEDPRGPEALGFFLISAALVSAIHDVIVVPDAARRTNARNALTNLSLAPVALPGRVSPSPGACLMGQF
jgi:hypothetical protein